MAENPQKRAHARPLSPIFTIYRWQVTMLASIIHRATGMALSAGAMVLAWWLVAISNGPEGYDTFHRWAAIAAGADRAVRLTWSLAFHLLQWHPPSGLGSGLWL